MVGVFPISLKKCFLFITLSAIIKSGVDMDTLQVEAVNEDFYIVNNMDFVFNCGGGTNGCTSSIPFHTHIQNFSHGTHCYCKIKLFLST